MPRGEHLKGKGGKKFTKTYQPPPENKIKGKVRLSSMKEALQFFGQVLKSTEQIEGQQVELTFESNIGFKLMQLANEGDLKAIEILTKLMPNWLQATKMEIKADIGAIKYKEVIK